MLLRVFYTLFSFFLTSIYDIIKNVQEESG